MRENAPVGVNARMGANESLRVSSHENPMLVLGAPFAKIPHLFCVLPEQGAETAKTGRSECMPFGIYDFGNISLKSEMQRRKRSFYEGKISTVKGKGALSDYDVGGA